MKIAFVLPSLDVGGAERQGFLLARHLTHQEGARVLLVSLSGAGRIGELCETAGVPYTLFRLRHPGRGLLFKVLDLLGFAAFLRRERVQVVLPYCMFPNVLCALTWRLGGARLCVWNQRDEGRERLEPLVERIAVRQVRCFVSNSEHGAEFLHSVLDVPEHAIHRIHNGVELPPPIKTGDAWRRALGIETHAFVACMVANLHHYKDHETLVAAWPRVVDRLARRGMNAHLLLAGAFRDRYQSLVEQVRRLALDGHVHFLGEVTDISGLLRAVDLAVFSSRAEGLPNAVLEAMAAGLPVAGTDYPGIREALGPSGAQLLARPGDAEDLGARIIAAALDPVLRATLGLQARRRIESGFTTQQMCRKMADAIVERLHGSKVHSATCPQVLSGPTRVGRPGPS